MQQGLAPATQPGLDLALPPKGPEIREVDRKQWWMLTTGQEHGLLLPARPAYHGNGPVDAGEQFGILSASCFPVFYLVLSHLRALTGAEAVCSSFGHICFTYIHHVSRTYKPFPRR